MNFIIRVRFCYQRRERLKFLSHLDVLKAFHRAFRRAKLPLLYRGDFNPQPRLDPGIPLPLGVTSSSEYGEVYLQDIEGNEFLERVTPQIPLGLDIEETALVSLEEPALMEQINCACYRLYWYIQEPGTGNLEFQEKVLQDTLQKMENAASLEVKRRGKKKKKKQRQERIVDIKPYIYHWEGSSLESSLMLELLLQTGNRGGAAPGEVLNKLREYAGDNSIREADRIHRTGLYWYDGEAIIPPRPFFREENRGKLVR